MKYFPMSHSHITEHQTKPLNKQCCETGSIFIKIISFWMLKPHDKYELFFAYLFNNSMWHTLFSVYKFLIFWYTTDRPIHKLHTENVQIHYDSEFLWRNTTKWMLLLRNLSIECIISCLPFRMQFFVQSIHLNRSKSFVRSEEDKYSCIHNSYTCLYTHTRFMYFQMNFLFDSNYLTGKAVKIWLKKKIMKKVNNIYERGNNLCRKEHYK